MHKTFNASQEKKRERAAKKTYNYEVVKKLIFKRKQLLRFVGKRKIIKLKSTLKISRKDKFMIQNISIYGYCCSKVRHT